MKSETRADEVSEVVFFSIEMRRRLWEGHGKVGVKLGERWAGEGDKNNLFCLKKRYKGDRLQQETTCGTKSRRDTVGGAERKRSRKKRRREEIKQ